MSNSPLVNYSLLSPNCNKPRNNKIKKITIHHMAGNLTVEKCGQLFASSSRKASSNYGIGTDGRIGMYVEECNRSWCSSSGANDHQAITIEVANDGGAPDWHVSDLALARLIELCVDICKRNDIPALIWTGDASGTLTCHYMFAATACPGPYLKSKMSYITEQVNMRLAAGLPCADPVRIKCGFASAGDVKRIKAIMAEKDIPCAEVDGYVTTDIPVSTGDQKGIVALCTEMGVPCVKYEPDELADLKAEVEELNKQIDATTVQLNEVKATADKQRKQIDGAVEVLTA